MSTAIDGNSTLEICLMMQRVKTQTVIFYPFFASLALHIPVYESTITDTMATDGLRVYYNKEWVSEIKAKHGEAALVGVYIHEVMHVALLHPTRGLAYTQQIYNIACDYVINNILDNSKVKLPDCVLINHEWDDMSAEQIYHLLMKDAKQGSGGSGGGKGEVIDDHGQWGKQSEVSNERLEEEWKQKLAAAAVSAKMQGNMPAGMERLINEILHPQVDWATALKNYVQPSAVDYGWDPPDRRFQDDDVSIPDMTGENIDNIVVVADTSGSVTEKMIAQFMGEIMDIIDTWPSMIGWLISCDAEVHQVIQLNDQYVPHELKGGGGTDFRPAFNKVDEMEIKPSCLIYLTDTYGSFPDNQPDYPVIWCVLNAPEGHVPWGERIDINIAE